MDGWATELPEKPQTSKLAENTEKLITRRVTKEK
jgi:hypothetical protein